MVLPTRLNSSPCIMASVARGWCLLALIYAIMFPCAATFVSNQEQTAAERSILAQGACAAMMEHAVVPRDADYMALISALSYGSTVVSNLRQALHRCQARPVMCRDGSQPEPHVPASWAAAAVALAVGWAAMERRMRHAQRRAERSSAVPGTSRLQAACRAHGDRHRLGAAHVQQRQRPGPVEGSSAAAAAAAQPELTCQPTTDAGSSAGPARDQEVDTPAHQVCQL